MKFENKVMFLHLSVSHCVHREGCYDVTYCYGQHPSSWTAPTPWTGQQPPNTAPTPLPRQHLPVSKRSICNLLECFLVYHNFCQKLHENECGQEMAGASLAPLRSVTDCDIFCISSWEPFPSIFKCSAYIYRPQTKLYLCTCLSFCSQGGTWAGNPQAGTTSQASTPPANACWDTVNKQAVRILLEYILVLNSLTDTLVKHQAKWSSVFFFRSDRTSCIAAK